MNAPQMLDVAIIGAGVCGLRLAGLLQADGHRVAVFEARERLGGRVLSLTEAGLDMGPTWFWPQTQPQITRLVAELGLTTFAQHDDGTVMRLETVDRAPETVAAPGLHGGAQRVSGGMARLVDALAARLPPGSLHRRHRLLSVRRRGDHLELLMQRGAADLTIAARHVVLALPPRVVDETIRFEPELPADLRSALRDTPTWMATAAKAAMRYDSAFWRAQGHSGNAFIQHHQAVLCEVFDACDEPAGVAALAGFFELTPAQRVMFRAGLPLMLPSQFEQLHGPGAGDGELLVHDWAEDPLVCSTLDREIPLTQHPNYGNPLFGVPHWDGQLLIGGSETARASGGYLEGALDAAARIAGSLAAQESTLAPHFEAGNEGRLSGFRGWVQAERAQGFALYRSELHQRLSRQDSEALTQQALLRVVESVYERALDQINRLHFDTRTLPVENGRSALTPQLLDPFMGFSGALLDEAVAFNRTSCALSNFPFEHKPDREYLDTIRRDLGAAWRSFALAANDLVLPESHRISTTGA